MLMLFLVLAMTEAETCAALATGWNAVSPEADMLVVGEMGIGNTSPAAASAPGTVPAGAVAL